MERIDPAKKGKQVSHKNRQFGLLTGSVLGLITAYMYWQKGLVNLYLCIPALLLITLAVIVPEVLTFLRITWEKMGRVLGTVNTYIILTLIYLFIFVPYGLMLKLFHRDILEKKIHRSATSYWQKSGPSGSSMKHQF